MARVPALLAAAGGWLLGTAAAPALVADVFNGRIAFPVRAAIRSGASSTSSA